MIEQDRLDKLKEERARRMGPLNVVSFSDIDLDKIRQARLDRLTAVWEAEHPQPTETAQKKNLNPVNPAEDPKNMSWWDKTKAFLSKHPSPMDYVQEKVGQAGGIVNVAKKAKEFIAPSRGFTEEQLKNAHPGVKETLSALSKYPANIAYGILDTASNLLMGPQEKTGPETFGVDVNPSTPGEAKVMQVADVATLLPMGSLKALKGEKLVSEIAKSTSESFISSALRGRIAEKEIPALSKVLKNVSNKEDVAKIISEAIPPQPQGITPKPKPLQEGGITPKVGEVKTQVPPAAETVPLQPIQPIESAQTTKKLSQDISYKEPSTVYPKSQVSQKDIVYEYLGQKAKTEEAIARNVDAGAKFWNKQSVQTNVDFIDRVMNGDTANLPKPLQQKATEYTARLDKVYSDIKQFKDVTYKENYFPGFWKNPERVKQAIAEGKFPMNEPYGILSKKPLAGTQSFAKQKIFQDMSTGIKLGYEPITYNPERMVALAEENANKFVTANKMFEEGKNNGYLKFVKPGDNYPMGWKPIDDKIAKVYFPSEQGLVYAGQYMADPQFAHMINNGLSQSAIRSSKIGRGLLKAKNVLNSVQLFSAFHATFEGINSIIDKIALGSSEALRLHPIRAAGHFIEAPVAPVLTAIRGRNLMKAALGGDETAIKVVDDFYNAGLRHEQNPIFRIRGQDTIKEGIKRAVYDFQNDRTLKGIGGLVNVPFRTIGNIMQKAMSPLFKYYIPSLKWGAMKDLSSSELLRNAGRIADGKTTKAEVLRNVAKNIDNRHGELNYDTMFLKNTVTDSGMVAFRSLGWQVGSVREIGGAGADVTKNVTGVFKGTAPGFTPKMAYTISIFTTLAGLGATYQYLHTGEKPNGLLDLYYPKNGLKNSDGSDQRVLLPSYLKDIKSVMTNPLRTVTNKLAPEISMTWDLLTNKDYWGDFIRNSNDTYAQQGLQVLDYLKTNIQPFAVQQQSKLGQGATTEQRIESGMGIVPLSQSLTDQPAETKARALWRELLPQGPKTPEQKQDYQDMLTKLSTSPQKTTEQWQAEADFLSKLRETKNATPERIQVIQDYYSNISEKERKSLNYKLMLAGIDTKGVSISEDIIKLKPVYNQVKDLISQGKKGEAQKIVDNLSADDYKAYQKVISSTKAAATKSAKIAMTPLVQKVKSLVESGQKAEANKIVNGLTDDEYRVYKLVVESL